MTNSERRFEFRKELAALLEKHNACFTLTSERFAYDGAVAVLTFDLLEKDDNIATYENPLAETTGTTDIVSGDIA